MWSSPGEVGRGERGLLRSLQAHCRLARKAPIIKQVCAECVPCTAQVDATNVPNATPKSSDRAGIQN